jgi:TolA-binding protein
MWRLLCSLIAFASLLLFTVNTNAQRAPRGSSIPLQIHGQVRYGEGARPAEFVLIRLESFNGGIVGDTTTDRSGRFIFTGLLPDLYTVIIRIAGYREVRQDVDMRTQITDYVQLQLVSENAGSRQSTGVKGGVLDANVPKQALSEFEKGHEALSQPNNMDESILHLENAVRIYPKYLEALLLLGTVYMDKREWEKAEDKLKQVLVIAPDTVGAHFALGELYFREKKFPDAEREMLVGIKLDPRSVQGHFMLGRLYYELGNIVKAGPQVGTALQLDPKFARGHLLAANIYLHVRQPQNAIIEFEEYLRLEPNGEFSEQAKVAIRKIRETIARS